MKEYIKLFENINAADGYVMDIPFTGTIVNIGNLVCNQEGKKIEINNGQIEIVDDIVNLGNIRAIYKYRRLDSFLIAPMYQDVWEKTGLEYSQENLNFVSNGIKWYMISPEGIESEITDFAGSVYFCDANAGRLDILYPNYKVYYTCVIEPSETYKGFNGISNMLLIPEPSEE